MSKVIHLIKNHEGDFETDGQYVVSYDPDATDGYLGSGLKASPNIEDAKQFEDLKEAVEYYRQTSKLQPINHRGVPNRPLTAYTVEFINYRSGDNMSLFRN